jgi:8-oxo-dGTP pyrophosphatase MutT (NUDIX family)
VVTDTTNPSRSRRPTHAGGVVYKLHNGTAEFLLVTSSRNPRQWVLPKGRIEWDETPDDTAAREVEEESGVQARIQRPLGQMAIRVRGEDQRIDFFLMRCVFEGESEEDRAVAWLSLDEAIERLEFEETRELLRRAARLI